MNEQGMSEISFEEVFTVDPDQTARSLFTRLEHGRAYAERLLEGLATGYLIALVESVCIREMLRHLDPITEVIVGSAVNIQHRAPVPPGNKSAARLDVPTRGAKDYVLGSSVRRPRGHLRRHLDAHGGLSRDYRKALGAQALNRRPPGAKRWQSAWQIDAGGRPCWARTSDQRIMHTTSAFAARFRFVVWTLSCLSAFPSSLYTFSTRSFARRWRGGNSSAVASTEFEKFYAKAE